MAMCTSASRAGARHRIAASAALAALVPLHLACAGATPAAPGSAAPPPEAPGALRVELRFGPEADLDLYVSDPSLETVYFANTPAKSGGALAGDQRCGSPPPRVEVVRWPSPPPGRYRVGVDFPERCEGGIDAASYELHVTGPGLSQEIRGSAAFGQLDSRVLEFEIRGSK
jgi:hypothetical protein